METQPKKYKSKVLASFVVNRNPAEFDKTKRNMLLAVHIDEALKSKGWSKKQLAEAMHKNPSKITNRTIPWWLSGTHNFTLETLYLIESYLGVTLFEVPTTELVTA